MIDPDAQATLLLSFLRERHQRTPALNQTPILAARRLKFSQRALAACGSALIALGNHLVQRGHYGPHRAPAATIVSDGGFTK